MCLAPELIKLGSDSTVTVGRWLTRSCAEVNSQHSTQTSIFHRNNDDCMGHEETPAVAHFESTSIISRAISLTLGYCCTLSLIFVRRTDGPTGTTRHWLVRRRPSSLCLVSTIPPFCCRSSVP